MSNLDKILRTLKYHFGIPHPMTWSFLLMYNSIMALLFFIAKCTLNNLDLKVSSTSLVGYSILNIIFVIFALVLPAILLMENKTTNLTGNYTGVGILIISALSGVPVMLLSTVLYNIVTWILLRFGTKIIYPAFFYYGGTSTKSGMILAVLSDTVIPAFGICIFFFGLVWSKFRNSQKKLAYVVITLSLTLFSMDIIGALSMLAIGWWCCKLRDKTDCVLAPFLCLVSSRICSIIFNGIITKIDIYSVQTYSDVPTTYFYAALPAIFIALILIGFFMRFLDDYNYSYFGNKTIEDNEQLPTLFRNLNFGLILAVFIMITIWILISTGVHV